VIENTLMPEQAVITAIKKQTYDTLTYTISFKDPERQQNYSFQPGQFNMLSLWGIGEAPISISSSPGQTGTFDHTIRSVGDVTNSLLKMEPGQLIGIRGPYGTGWPVEKAKHHNVMIVAGGIGLAPIRPFIMHIFENRKQFGSLEILYGVKTPSDLLFSDELEQWASQPDTHIHLSADKVPEGTSWAHQNGVVTTLFNQIQTPPQDAVMVICGPEIMMKFTAFSALGIGVKAENITVSLERRMKCGVGMCGHCQIGSHFVCQCGPVFPYQNVKHVFGAV
jgi:NAD(P)H-flavin reductase